MNFNDGLLKNRKFRIFQAGASCQQLIKKETPTQVFSCEICKTLKNTHREKAPSNKSMNMDIWVVNTSN